MSNGDEVVRRVQEERPEGNPAAGRADEVEGELALHSVWRDHGERVEWRRAVRIELTGDRLASRRF